MFSTISNWFILWAWSSTIMWITLSSTAWFTLFILSKTNWVCFNYSFSTFINFLYSSGRCITAMGRKYHVEHFICSYCTRQLQNGTFKEYQNKPYCHPCFIKLFAWTVFRYIDSVSQKNKIKYSENYLSDDISFVFIFR